MSHRRRVTGIRFLVVLLIGAVSTALAEDPPDGDARAVQALMDAMQALDAGDFDGCARSYREALDRAERADVRFQARLGLATCLGAAGRLVEASREAERAARDAPEEPVAQHAAGAALLDIAQPEAAEPYLLKAVELAPEFALAWRSLGRCHAAQGENQAAEDAYGRALQLDEEDGGAWLGLAVARYQQERYEVALTAFNEAVARTPDFPAARYGRGACRLMLGDREGASAEARALEELDPRLARHLFRQIAEADATPGTR